MYHKLKEVELTDDEVRILREWLAQYRPRVSYVATGDDERTRKLIEKLLAHTESR